MNARDAAIRLAQDLLADHGGNMIAGGWQPATGEGSTPVHDPATGDRIGTIGHCGGADVDQAVAAARTAQPCWARLSIGQRTAALDKLLTRCVEHADQFAALEVLDAGKPVTAVRESELPGTWDSLRLFAAAVRLQSAPAAGEYVPGATSIMRREPHGVVAAITPWNYPLLEAICKIAPALASGNTVVLKPAESTPLSTMRLADLARTVLPPGVFNLVLGAGPTGDALVRHPDVAMVAFTGSIRTGSTVAAAAATGLKKVLMELGGNAPVLIFDDADIAAALDVLVPAGLYNAGQDCMAASRLLVHHSLHDQFAAELAQRCAQVTVGDTFAADTDLGPLISAAQRDAVEAKLAGRTAGDIICGGTRPELSGYYLLPTVVSGAGNDDPLVKDEIFGPVFTVQPFTDDDEALHLANNSVYGLAASVFTRDVGRAVRLSNALDAGTVWVNNHLLYGPDLPMSGFKQSGIGTESSLMGIGEYSRVKHIAFDHR